MEPFKSLVPLAKWLLRIAFAVFSYVNYFEKFKSFSFDGKDYFIALIFVALAAALLIGGFIKKNTVTVISGLLIVALCVVMMFLASGGIGKDSILAFFIPATLGFYFLARGNRG